MIVQTLLDQAATCKTREDAEKLLFALQEAFTDEGPLSHLPVYNPDHSMDDDGPYVQFELNRVISDHYITCIKPEIRSGELAIVVRTWFMKDGHGIGSGDYELVEGFDEEVIEADGERTIEDLATRAKELAIADHRLLIERVGVPEGPARQAALDSW